MFKGRKFWKKFCGFIVHEFTAQPTSNSIVKNFHGFVYREFPRSTKFAKFVSLKPYMILLMQKMDWIALLKL